MREKQKREHQGIDWQSYATDPLRMKRDLWPNVRFYDKQVEIIESVRDNDETVVVAGHQLGKDFVTGFICLWYFLAHPTVRIIATSVKDDHLRVLFGEVGRYVQTSAAPLDSNAGGPLIMNHRDIRKRVDGAVCPISYFRGMVSEKGEGMAGHHAPFSMLVVDEASGVDDLIYERADTWSKRKLIIGNPYQTTNFFYRGVKEGDLVAG